MCSHTALNQKRPLHLWCVTCPFSCGPGIGDEEQCSDEMFQKSWHTEDIWAQTYILDLSHLLILAQLWLGSRLSALPRCLWPSTPNPLPSFFSPNHALLTVGKEKTLFPVWSLTGFMDMEKWSEMCLVQTVHPIVHGWTWTSMDMDAAAEQQFHG